MPRNSPYGSNQYLSHSKLQSPLTTKWLNEHYEVSQGVSLPRSSLYAHYLDFCQKSGLNPVNAASFGKIIRHNFPNLKTRRLGTRGQSKYHYYGITIKESSPYHDTLLNTGRQPAVQSSGAPTKSGETSVRNQTFNTGKSSSSNQQCLMSSSGGTLLPLFPKCDSLNLPTYISKDKVRTFLIMYRAHCQRILDTILRANFGEVQKFLIHFWQGMPEHILSILSCPEVIDLVGVCDGILFKAIGSVLIPGVLQPLPASLTQAIRQFATQLNSWLESSLAHFPEKLKQKKLDVANTFSKSLRRKTSLTHLAQAARTVLHSPEPVAQMVNDWQEIDFNEIVKQTLWTFSSNPEADCEIVKTFLQDFTELLEQQATIDQYAEWASKLVDTCVKLDKRSESRVLPFFHLPELKELYCEPQGMSEKYIEEEDSKAYERSRQFLLKWSFFGTQVMRELTLKSAQSFGSFHLLRILLEDYIVYCVECKASSQTLDAGLETKMTANGEQCDNVMEVVEAQDVCDIEVMDEASRPLHPTSSSSQPNVAHSPRNFTSRKSAYPEVYADQYRVRPPRMSVVVPGPDYVTPHEKISPPVAAAASPSPVSPSSATTECRPYPYFGPGNPESPIHNYLAVRSFNSIPGATYGVTQNMYGGAVYTTSMNAMCSSNELKTYAQYAMQETPSYNGRYLPSNVVSAPLYAARDLYSTNNSQHRNEHHTGHQGYDHRIHTRIIAEGAQPQPVLGAL